MAETVTVACKLPNGIHLDVYRMEEFEENTVMGTRKSKRAVHDGRVTVAGVKRRSDDPRLADGFALTPGVDAEHWRRWLEANKDSALVRNGLIFARGKEVETRAQSREHERQRSGLEPVDPKDLPQEFKRKIETASRPAA